MGWEVVETLLPEKEVACIENQINTQKMDNKVCTETAVQTCFYWKKIFFFMAMLL